MTKTAQTRLSAWRERLPGAVVLGKFLILAMLAAAPCLAQDASVEVIQNWNIHGQVTETPQGDPSFRALYSGPNSLNNKGEVQETFTSAYDCGMAARYMPMGCYGRDSA
jgi:hypothetical protein